MTRIPHVHRQYGFIRGTALALVFAFLGWAVAGVVLLAGVAFWIGFSAVEQVTKAILSGWLGIRT